MKNTTAECAPLNQTDFKDVWNDLPSHSNKCSALEVVVSSPQILLGFTLFYLFLAIFSNWVRHTSIGSTFKRVKSIVKR